MSDYSTSYNGAAKDAAESTILGADFDTEFAAIETAVATKANKTVPAAAGNVAVLSSSGDLQDGAVTATELAILDGATVTTAELNTLDGITATTAELNILDGVTSTAAELNVLDGIPGTLTATELGYVDGVTSAIQTQLDSKAATSTWTLLDTWTPTAVASKDFTWDESLYTDVKIILENIIPATDSVAFYCRFGHTDGGTILTTNYEYNTMALGTATLTTATTQTQINLTATSSNVGTDTGEGLSGTINLSGYGGVKGPKLLISTIPYTNAAGVGEVDNTWGYNKGGLTTPYDTIRLYWSSGNFEANGTIYVYGLKRS